MKAYPLYIGSGNIETECRVVVQRGDAVYDLNPRLNLRCHSPDGFAWGYGGSGPAQLSLALLADFFGRTTKVGDLLAVAFYQDFKFAAIAPLQGDAWTLDRDEVLGFLREIWQRHPEEWTRRIERDCRNLATTAICKTLDAAEAEPESGFDFDELENQLCAEYTKTVAELLREVVA